MGATTDADDRIAGVALAGASLLSVVAMAHHPSGASAYSGLTQMVHGVMIAVILVSAACFTRFAIRIGLNRFGVLLGLVTYFAGAAANVLAATMNGFVAPAVHGEQGAEALLRLCWELNQAFAYGAVYATSASFVLWGLALLRHPERLDRVIAVVSIVAGGVAATLLAMEIVRMNVAGAFIVYATQAGMGVLVGRCLCALAAEERKRRRSRSLSAPGTIRCGGGRLRKRGLGHIAVSAAFKKR